MSEHDNSSQASQKKGVIKTTAKLAKHVTGSPSDAVGWRQISGNFNVIRLLWTILKLSAKPEPHKDEGKVPNPPSLQDDDHELIEDARNDIVGKKPLPAIRSAIPYRYLTDDDLYNVIRKRQRETFFRALCAGLLTIVLFIMWSTEMIFFPWTSSRLLSSVAFLPFLALLGSVSLWNCSVNWQLRTRQIATFREFLDRADSLLPRLP